MADEKFLKDHMRKRLGKKKRLSSLRSTSKEVKALYGQGHLARSIANSTCMMIKEGIKSGKIITTDEIDEIIENSRNEYKKRLEKCEIQRNTKSKQNYRIILYRDNKRYFYNECIIQIFKDKLKVTYKDEKVKGSLKQISWPILFKGINFMVLINNGNGFEIKTNNGSKFRFISEEPLNINYTKNLFNELKSKLKDYQLKNKHEVITESKPANPFTEKDLIDQIKKLDEFRESDLITNEEYREHLERIKAPKKTHEEKERKQIKALKEGKGKISEMEERRQFRENRKLILEKIKKKDELTPEEVTERKKITAQMKEEEKKELEEKEKRKENARKAKRERKEKQLKHEEQEMKKKKQQFKAHRKAVLSEIKCLKPEEAERERKKCAEKEAKKRLLAEKRDSLLKSDNYTFVKDFMDRWGDDNYTKQLLKILHKKLDNKGFKIDEKDLKPLLIYIKKLEEGKELNEITKYTKFHPLLKSDSYKIVKDFVNRFGDDNYPDVLFKDLHKRLGNLGFKIDENDLKLLCIRTRKLGNLKRRKCEKTELESIERSKKIALAEKEDLERKELLKEINRKGKELREVIEKEKAEIERKKRAEKLEQIKKEAAEIGRERDKREAKLRKENAEEEAIKRKLRKKRAEKLEQERKERTKKEKKERKERVKKFISCKDYLFLENFVKKYGHYLNNAPNPNFEKKVDDLKKLLELKGHNFESKMEIKNLMYRELKIQEYNDFKFKILYDQPNDIKEYIKNFLDVFGENYRIYDNFFKELLTEEGISFDGNLNSLIGTVIEERKLEIFEKELSDFGNKGNFIPNLDSLDGYEFEKFLSGLFDKMGFITENTKLSGDQGADLIIKKFGIKTAVQAKRYAGKVNNKAVQEVVASIAHYGANKGMVVTTGKFTNSAIELAKSNNIKLVNRQKLEELIDKYY